MAVLRVLTNATRQARLNFEVAKDDDVHAAGASELIDNVYRLHTICTDILDGSGGMLFTLNVAALPNKLSMSSLCSVPWT
jgi:hypothetical protein